jgi:hypothetical protein
MAIFTFMAVRSIQDQALEFQTISPKDAWERKAIFLWKKETQIYFNVVTFLNQQFTIYGFEL